MGQIKLCAPVKLIIGFIFKEETAFQKARQRLLSKYGAIDFESDTFSFAATSYYEKELGAGLFRKFVSFTKLISPLDLSAIKIFTNALEQRYAVNGLRTINIDPGYLNLARLVLASTKDFSHRIYLGKGIFGEITLIFKDKSFQHLDWTYPDYRSQEYISIFHQIRKIYFRQQTA